MVEVCLTVLSIAIICNITKVVMKKMEIKYMDKKNEKEGKYVN